MAATGSGVVFLWRVGCEKRGSQGVESGKMWKMCCPRVDTNE